jgi:hypothetical protein
MSAMKRATYYGRRVRTLGRSKDPKAVSSPTIPNRQRIPRQMISFHCLCPISVSLIRENLRVWRQAHGQTSWAGFVDWRFR